MSDGERKPNKPRGRKRKYTIGVYDGKKKIKEMSFEYKEISQAFEIKVSMDL